MHTIPDPATFLKQLFDTAVASAEPGRCLAEYLPPPVREGQTLVVGAGKGSAAMAAAVEEAFQRSAEASLGGKKELEKAEKEEMKARVRAVTGEAGRGRGHEFFEGFESEDADDVVVDCKDETEKERIQNCLLYTSPSPRDATLSRMPSSA